MNEEALIIKRSRIFFIILLFLLLAAFLVSNGLGSMKISPERILQVLCEDDGSPQRLVI